ncbi:MAG: basic secretory protein-like protein [Bacteroidales bacterium]
MPLTINRLLVGAIFMAFPLLPSCEKDDQQALQAQSNWSNYTYDQLEIKGEFDPPTDKGTELVLQVFPDLKATITQQSRIVQNLLYSSEVNAMPAVKNLQYTIKPSGPISGKGGGAPTVYISVNTEYLEKFYNSHNQDTARFKREFIGMLTHELTHAFQLEPKGCGRYDGKSEFWAFIEGMADAMRYLSGDKEWKKPKPGGTYLSGYETTGFFLIYLQDRFDPHFVMKFHETAAKLPIWSFDGAIKEVLGERYSLDKLWDDYQKYLLANN